MNPILIAIAKAVENNATANQTVLDSFPDEIREYLAYIDAVRDTLSRRDTMQIEYELTVDELAKKRQEKDQVYDYTHTYVLPKFILFCQFIDFFTVDGCRK